MADPQAGSAIVKLDYDELMLLVERLVRMVQKRMDDTDGSEVKKQAALAESLARLDHGWRTEAKLKQLGHRPITRDMLCAVTEHFTKLAIPCRPMPPQLVNEQLLPLWSELTSRVAVQPSIAKSSCRRWEVRFVTAQTGTHRVIYLNGFDVDNYTNFLCAEDIWGCLGLSVSTTFPRWFTKNWATLPTQLEPMALTTRHIQRSAAYKGHAVDATTLEGNVFCTKRDWCPKIPPPSRKTELA